MSQRVAIYGIDLTGQGFPNAYRALEEVLAFLDHADPKLGIATRADFADVVKFRVDRFTMLSQAEQNRISLKIDDLVALLALKRPQLTAATSSNNYEWALRHAINAKQDDDYLRLAPPGWQGWASEFPQKPNLLFESRFRDMLTMREVAMADNLRWVLERSGPQGRVVLFAHDNHVKMHELRLRSSEPDFSSWDGLQPAGVFARSELGNDLVVIGTYYGTAEGFETTNHVLPPNQHAMDGLLASLGLPTYLIDLRELPKLGPLADWFLCSHEVRDGLAGINLVRASEAYDAILYIDRLTPSRRPTDLQSSDR
ncbi:MAG: erythromycin esterase family protein [Terriglobia bacterium]